MRMMMSVLLSACLLLASPVLASGSLGIFALIDRVVFEPNAESPETVQIFGAFAYYAPASSTARTPAPDARSVYTDAVRGYLYFRLPARGDVEIARREWADLAAVAGTGEAVAFGGYGFIGAFEAIAADIPSNTVGSRTESGEFGYPLGLGQGVQDIDVEPAIAAEYYPSDFGVVRLGEGNYEDLMADLKALLDE